MNSKPVVAAVAIALGAFALAACDRQEMNAKTDRAVAKTEAAVEKAGDKIEQAAVKVEKTAQEAAITAAINAGLVKDPELSALRINVDTVGSVVTLNGKAPNPAAVERAQRIAIATNGVTEVHNNLTLGT
jgi:osmotically-inducible protein OsmY